jgi:small-conductance mechanosensitive channel
MAAAEMYSPLSLGEAEWMNEYGWAVLAVIGLFVFLLYIWSYLSKHFELMRAKEGKYTDSDVIDFLERFMKIAITMILLFSLFYVASLMSEWFNDYVWDPFSGYALDLILIVIVVMIAMLIVRILRRVARRARIKSNGEESIHPSAVEFTSLFMSYVVYAVTGAVVILILISLVPDFNLTEAITTFLNQNAGSLMITAVIVIAIYFLDRLIEAILEDFKFRTKKFSPKEVDFIKTGVRYGLFFIGALTAIFSILLMLGLELVGMVLVITVITFLCLVLALSYSTIQNIVAGFGLMDTGPFDVGDRIGITGGFIGDVIEKGLVFTRVRTLEGEIVDMPNSEMIEEKIFNYTLSGDHGIRLEFEVSYSVPHGKVERIVKRAAEQVDNIIEGRKPKLYAKDIIGNNIVFDVVVFTNQPVKDRRIRSNLIFKLQEEFHKEGLTLMLESDGTQR